MASAVVKVASAVVKAPMIHLEIGRETFGVLWVDLAQVNLAYILSGVLD